MGMKYFRIKMAPIEDFEASFQFMNECAQYFIEYKDKDIKHALANLFVEILVPLVANIKHEVNIPCLKNFVETLFPTSLELSTRNKHRLALFPLVTCLLCVSQKQFFLNNWQIFLTLCLQKLKDSAQVALESIYRLLWVYMIRIKCEKTNETNHRLQTIISSLFPKGTKLVIPKDMPVNIFVQIINIIAYEKLDFAMREIIYDLLAVGKNTKDINPLRMDIGLRAWLTISENLQKKEGPPPMPLSITIAQKNDSDKLYNSNLKMLTESLARDIGLSIYFEPLRRAFQDILKVLDNSIGRTVFLMTRTDNSNSKEMILSNDNKSKIILLKTCVSAIPRFVPNVKESELIDMLARYTIHIDDELKVLAFKSLQTFVIEFPQWRKWVFMGYCNFILKEINDLYSNLIENTFKTLIQLTHSWKSALTFGKSELINADQNADDCQTLCHLEGFSILILCQSVATRRRYALTLLREVKQIGNMLNCFDIGHNFALDVIDNACEKAVKHLNSYLNQRDRYLIVKRYIKPDLHYLIEQSILWEKLNDSDFVGHATLGHHTSPTSLTSATLGYLNTIRDNGIGKSVSYAINSFNILRNSSYMKTNLNNLLNSGDSSISSQTIHEKIQNETSGVGESSDNQSIISRDTLVSNQSKDTTPVQSADSVSNSLSSSLNLKDQQKLNSLQSDNIPPAATLINYFNQNQKPSTSGYYSSMSTTLSYQPQTQSNENSYGYDAAHFDPWTECLGIFLSHEFLFSKCPQSRMEAWPYIFTRLTQLFPLIDPVDIQHESRTSLFGISLEKAKKQASDRMLNLFLWKNYVTCAFCLTPGSGKTHLMTNESLLSMDTFTLSSGSSNAIENSKFYTSCGTVNGLLKIIVPLIKCECNDTREIAIRGLGHMNIDAFRDLFEELVPHIREAIDRRQERLKRIRKRDQMRLTLIRIFEYSAESGTFARIIGEKSDETIRKTFVDYIEAAYLYLEQENDKNSDVLTQIRIHFSKFISKIIMSIEKTKRGFLLEKQTRSNLFYLIDKWCGRFGLIHNTNHHSTRSSYTPISCEQLDTLEIEALKACAALLCCGDLFETTTNGKSTSDENQSSPSSSILWLNQLLNANDQYKSKFLYKLTLKTLIQLLEFNNNNSDLADWLIQKCYSSSIEIADLCFMSLAKVYIEKGLEVYVGSILTITLLNIGCVRMNIHETAIKLLKVINQRHLQDISPESQPPDFDIINSLVIYSKSQLFISEYIARKNPEQTMQIFAEITSKLELATFSTRQTMLTILVPWIYNLELVDPNVIVITQENCNNGLALLPGCGYGCVSATQMILTNLFYLTSKYSDEHSRDLELLWAILVSTWSHNLKIIIRFLFIIITLAPYECIVYAKKICTYLSKSCPQRLLEELISEIDSVESFCSLVQKTLHPPYYRYKNTTFEQQTQNQKTQQATNEENDSSTTTTSSSNNENETPTHQNIKKTSSTSLISEQRRIITKSPSDKKDSPIQIESSILPMPLFGGYYCPLNNLMYSGNENQENNNGQNDNINIYLLRGNISIILLSELMSDGADFDWTNYYATILHFCILTFDNSRALICEHAKKLFLNTLYVMSVQHEIFTLTDYLLENMSSIVDNQSMIYDRNYLFQNKIELRLDDENNCLNNSLDLTQNSSSNSQSLNCSIQSIVNDSNFSPINQAKEILQWLLRFMCSRKNVPLWSCESISAYNYKSVESVKSLSLFVSNLKRYLVLCVPHLCLDIRWSQYSVYNALHSSSRHFAGRSFQIFRALDIEFTSLNDLTCVLARLMETISESNEELQGYVAEILLTLKSNAELISKEYLLLAGNKTELSSSYNKPQQTGSLPAAPNRDMVKIKSSALSRTFPNNNPAKNNQTQTKFQIQQQQNYDQSLTLSLFDRKWFLIQKRLQTPIQPHLVTSPQKAKISSIVEVYPASSTSSSVSNSRVNLNEQKSKQSSFNTLYSNYASMTINKVESDREEKLRILIHLFWTGISLLESDYEYEFLLATELLETILTSIPVFEFNEINEKLDKFTVQLKWPNFPGLQNLLIKGCTSAFTNEATCALLVNLIPYTTNQLIDSNGYKFNGLWGFSMNLMSLLPYMILNYDKPNEICLRAAQSYVKYLQQEKYQSNKEGSPKNDQLQNLAKILNSYLNDKFQKDRLYWTRCVLFYLCDYFVHNDEQNTNFHLNWIIYLTELLEKNSQNQKYQICVLYTLNSLLNCINFNDKSKWTYINNELLRILVPYLNGALWKDALELIRLAVSKSSSLLINKQPFSFQPTFNEVETTTGKKELPGRTLEFDFDFAPYNLSDSRHSSPTTSKKSSTDETANEISTINSRKLKINNFKSSWKKPHLSQSRTREKFVALLNSSGAHVGLPKSPSVIFSQYDVTNGGSFINAIQQQSESDLDENHQDNDVIVEVNENEEFQSKDGIVIGGDSKPNEIRNSHSNLMFDDNNFITDTFSFLDDLDSWKNSQSNKLDQIAEASPPRDPLEQLADQKIIITSNSYNSLTLSNEAKKSAKEFLSGKSLNSNDTKNMSSSQNLTTTTNTTTNTTSTTSDEEDEYDDDTDDEGDLDNLYEEQQKKAKLRERNAKTLPPMKSNKEFLKNLMLANETKEKPVNYSATLNRRSNISTAIGAPSDGTLSISKNKGLAPPPPSQTQSQILPPPRNKSRASVLSLNKMEIKIQEEDKK